MAKKSNIIRGQFVSFDVYGLRITQALRDALAILDADCRGGAGGIWDVFLDGRTYVAAPDSSFDSVTYDRKRGRWVP